MIKSFLKYLKFFVKNIVLLDSTNCETNKLIGLSIFGFGTGLILTHYSYALKTCETKIIKISGKYKFNRNGFTEFMIVDDSGAHYNVNNSLWYWKWDSIEDWYNLQLDKDIVIKYYGWRIPVFGLFPNIIMSKQSNLLSSMTTQEFISKTNKEKELTHSEKEKMQIQLNPYYNLLNKR